jgi:processive 1,2-diacylglycerol beta-glucosyltransferase
MTNPRVLILTIPHGAAHERVARALRAALLDLRPELKVEIANALAHCARWFRAYYDSYEIPLKYWPELWGWIEGKQHSHTSTGPGWLYRRGTRGLLRFIAEFNPDILIATEVGTCEWAAMYKRQQRSNLFLVGATAGVDIDRPWAQPEVDLYPVMPGDVAAQLEAAGVPAGRILPCGVPIDPAFGSTQNRGEIRKRLGIKDSPLVLVMFGGGGHGRPRTILEELGRISPPVQGIFVTGRNRRREEEVRHLAGGNPHFQVLGWVENMHEWLAVADLLISKPGGMTVTEAINSGVPLLAFDPFPGAERRACELIEKWQVGEWIRRPEDLAASVKRLLENPQELERMRANARALARPHAAGDAARAILECWENRAQAKTKSG